MEKKVTEISWNSLWRIVLMIALVATFLVAKQAFFVFFLAIVLASAIDPIVNFFEKRRFPRGLAVLLIFIVGLAILTVLLYTIIPIVAIELRELFNHLENKLPAFLKPIASIQFLINPTKGGENIVNTLLSGSESLVGIASKFFGNIVFLLAALVLTFYLSISKQGVENFLRAILPRNQEERIVNVYLKIKQKLGHWLQAQLFLSLIIASLSFLGLRLLGVKYSLLLGATAGVLDLIPMAGPIVAGAIAFFVAFSHSWALGVYVIILFFVIQQLEAHILLPLVMRKIVGVNPALIILVLLTGYAIASWAGVLLAVPAAVTIQEIADDFSRRKAVDREKEQ